ncbi:MAG TPA: hypothetical protein VKQ72_05165 [Aggregatilineales bacterium]|nr:hypothetical protein [Aggregatilineales bacterium]
MTVWRRVLSAVSGLFLAGVACSIGGSLGTPTPNNAPVPPSIVPTAVAQPPAPPPPTEVDTAIPTVTATVSVPPTASSMPLAIVNPSGTPSGSQCAVTLAEPKNFVKVRNGPGFDFEAVAILQTYSSVIGINGAWYEIPLFGDVGWVSNTVTKLVGPCQTIPTVVFTPNPSH